jgi:replicative DNA helicase
MNEKSEILDRTPPGDQTAEMGLLGSVLLKPDVLDDLSVSPEDFRDERHQTLYRTLITLRAEQKPLDAVVLCDRLQASGELMAVGGVEHLAEIVHSTPHAANAAYYADIIVRTARCRALIQAATQILHDAWEPGAEAEDILDQAERSLTAIRTGDSSKTLVDGPTASIRAMDRIDLVYRRERQPGLPTGLPEFDHQFGGMFPGELCILAARLGVGKTSMACQWTDHNAGNGRLAYFASLEMDAAELATRILCTLANVSGAKIRNASINETDIAALGQAGRDFSHRTIRFDERPRLRVADIRRETRKLLRHGLRLVVVDYLQIIAPDDRRVPREQQVAKIASDLKELARELSVPVLALAQLNRQAGEGVAPGAEHLRESDAIGQAADMVLTLTVTDKKEDAPPVAWLRVNKNRNGPKGKLQLDWHPDTTTFTVHQDPDRENRHDSHARPYEEFTQYGAAGEDF